MHRKLTEKAGSIANSYGKRLSALDLRERELCNANNISLFDHWQLLGIPENLHAQLLRNFGIFL